MFVLRCVFVIISVGLGASLAKTHEPEDAWMIFGGVLLLAAAALTADLLVRKKRIDTISCIYIGTIVGAFLSYALRLAMEPLLPDKPSEQDAMQLVFASVLIYYSISILLQTRDHFRFIIPYVEFVREVKGLNPYVLDTSAIMDGRIADLVKTGVLEREFIMPQFVLAELQQVADSSNRMKR
ncbi:MAG: PIN/TRAM domain-containing protein, partial [Planctomycetales bacterium]